MRGFGGMVSVTLKDADLQETFRIASRFKVFSLAESLGGVESLVNHPVSMTHGSIPKEAREKVGVTDNLLRFSVGVEDIDDLYSIHVSLTLGYTHGAITISLQYILYRYTLGFWMGYINQQLTRTGTILLCIYM
jgi:hypothetical protein